MNKIKTKEGFWVFHSKRRIFAIINNKLMIGPKNYPKSHDDWFVKEGWIKNNDDPLQEKITRGMVDPEGNIHFYVGKNLRLTKKSEKEIFSHLKELVDKLKISKEAEILGGMIKGAHGTLWFEETGVQWKARKNFGKVKDFI